MQEKKQIIILIEMKNQKNIDLYDFYDIAGAIGDVEYRNE